MKERKVEIWGNQLYIKESEKNGPSLLLLHCSSWNSEQWKGCFAKLSKSHHVIAPDLRGHGRSDCPADGYGLKDFSKDIYHMLEQMAIEKVHIVGSSMGAEIALCFASTYPKKVMSLTLEGAFQNFYGLNGEIDIPKEAIESDCKSRVNTVRARSLETYQTLEDLKNHYKRCGSWNESLESIHLNRFRQDEAGEYRVVFEPSFLALYCEDYYKTDFSIMYKKLFCPVQFLPDERETKDEKLMKSIEVYKSYINNDNVIIRKIEGAEHAMTPVKNPSGYVKAILDFISNLEN